MGLGAMLELIAGLLSLYTNFVVYEADANHRYLSDLYSSRVSGWWVLDGSSCYHYS